MQEEWKDVVISEGIYKDRYQVSNFGRVRAHPNVNVRGAKAEKILFQSKDDKGYSQVCLYQNYKQTTTKVHRLVATSFLGKREGRTVNHIDGDKSNNRLDNLEYISNKDNCRHAYRVIESRSGIHVDGEKMSIPEAVDRYGVDGVTPKSVHRRIYRYGWAAKDALMTPLKKPGRPTKEKQYVRK